MELDQKILENGKIEVENILKNAKKEADKEAKDIVSEAKLDNFTKYSNLRKETQSEIKMKSKLLNFEIKQAELLAKQKVIEEIFSIVMKKINALEGNDLLKYVSAQIKRELHILENTENSKSSIIMHTNKTEYLKYLSALSSTNQLTMLLNEKISLDKLNKELGMSIALSNEFMEIDGGFILVTKDFDLNFSTEELINSLTVKYESEIIEELFE